MDISRDTGEAAGESLDRAIMTSAPLAGIPLPDEAAQRVADTMFALSTPSRLQILAALRSGPLTVSEIVAVVGMEQSAVSHQLRVLRDQELLRVRRLGRSRQYTLKDLHVAALIDQALAHVMGIKQGTEDPDGEALAS